MVAKGRILLALLSIENKLLEKIDTDDITKSFALSKSRKYVIVISKVNTLLMYLLFVSIVSIFLFFFKSIFF